MAKEIILLYGIDNQKENKIKRVCLQLGIQVRRINPDQYQLPIGMLLLMKEPIQEIGNRHNVYISLKRPIVVGNDLEISEEMMIMNGFSDQSMDRFFERMKKSNISGIALKAVVTEFNKNWSSIQLYHELKLEQKQLQ